MICFYHLDKNNVIEIRVGQIGIGLKWELYIRPIVVGIAWSDRGIMEVVQWNDGFATSNLIDSRQSLRETNRGSQLFYD